MHTYTYITTLSCSSSYLKHKSRINLVFCSALNSILSIGSLCCFPNHPPSLELPGPHSRCQVLPQIATQSTGI